MWWIGVFLFLHCYDPCLAQEVNVEFLTAVPRFNMNETTNSNMIVDYYFCCNAKGRFINWEYNNDPLTGFLINNIGKVIVDNRPNYTYTATLLSSQPVDNNQAHMDSVLVISFPSNAHPGLINVKCSSNRNTNSTYAGTLGHVEKHNENEVIQLDYVTSGKAVRNRNKTYIFLCGVQNASLFVEVAGRMIGFSRFDNVGQNRDIFLHNRNTVDIQGILIARELYQTVFLIFVSTFSDIVNVSCSTSLYTLFLSSDDEDESAVTGIVMTSAILTTNTDSTELLIQNATEIVRSKKLNSRIPYIIAIISIISTALIGTLTCVAITATKYGSYLCSTRRVREQNTGKSVADTIHKYSESLSKNSSDRCEANDGGICEDELTRLSSMETSFQYSQEETTLNNQASAKGPVTSPIPVTLTIEDDRNAYTTCKECSHLAFKAVGIRTENGTMHLNSHFKPIVHNGSTSAVYIDNQLHGTNEVEENKFSICMEENMIGGSIEAKQNIREDMRVGAATECSRDSEISDFRGMNLKKRGSRHMKTERVCSNVKECDIRNRGKFMKSGKDRQSARVHKSAKVNDSLMVKIKSTNYTYEDGLENPGGSFKKFWRDKLRQNLFSFLADYEPMDYYERNLADSSETEEPFNHAQVDAVVPVKASTIKKRRRKNN